MSRVLTVLTAQGASIQDAGRPGYLAFGLSRGGAADPVALAEGAALLGQHPDTAAVELAGFGGRFRAGCDLRVALTGAEAPAEIAGARVAWNACHLLPAGSELRIGPARGGVYAYVHVGGGFETPLRLGGRGAHLAAGLGSTLTDGQALPVAEDAGGETGHALVAVDRFGGGTLRVVESLQTGLFPRDTLDRFQNTGFVKDARANRMGVRLAADGASIEAPGGRTVLSEVIVPGDIQITGDGTPFVLLSECQTTGGYPRIATVIPCDLPRVSQARPGDVLRFRFVSEDEALAAESAAARELAALASRVAPIVRNPEDMGDLLSYHLISGAVAGDEEGEA